MAFKLNFFRQSKKNKVIWRFLLCYNIKGLKLFIMDKHFLQVKFSIIFEFKNNFLKENITLPLWKEISNFLPELSHFPNEVE